jgi:hypothetical protein
LSLANAALPAGEQRIRCRCCPRREPQRSRATSVRPRAQSRCTCGQGRAQSRRTCGQGRAQPRRRCGTGEPSPGADVAAGESSPSAGGSGTAQPWRRCGRDHPSPGADSARADSARPPRRVPSLPFAHARVRPLRLRSSWLAARRQPRLSPAAVQAGLPLPLQPLRPHSRCRSLCRYRPSVPT